MIDVKQIAKAKSGNGGGSSSSTTIITGVAEQAKYAVEAGKAEKSSFADQAKNADKAAYATRSSIADKATSLDENSQVYDQFIRKDKDDSTSYWVTFLKGLKLGSDGKYYITDEGKAVLKSIIADTLQSSNFTEGELGSGYGITDYGSGKKLEVDYLLVRRIATFIEMEIRKLSYVGGNILLSQAGSVIEKVEEVTDSDGNVTGWKCSWTNDDGTTATSNTWIAGDQARCQTFNIKEGVYENVSNSYYWRLVTEVGDGYVVLSKEDCDDGSGIPKKGDSIVQCGYRLGYNSSDSDPNDENNERRTTVIMLSTSDEDSPSIKMYASVTSYELKDSNRTFWVSPDGFFVNAKYAQIVHDGVNYTYPLTPVDWISGTTYSYPQQVLYDDCTWLCIDTDGTTDTPSEDSSAWKLMSGTPTKGRTMTIYLTYLDGSIVLPDGLIAEGETQNFCCKIVDNKGNDHTSEYTVWSIVRQTEDTASDTVWNQGAVINSDGTFSLTYGTDNNDIGGGSYATFTIVALVGENDSTNAASASFVI